MGRLAGCKAFLVGAALLASSQVSGATLTVVISDVRSDVGALNIGIYDNKNDWLGSTTVQKRSLTVLENNVDGVVTTSFEVEPGEYAISVHHDDNDNGKMDTNFIGIPKEPTGLSNGAVPKFGPPKYKDAAFLVGNENLEMPIKLLD
ncbi:DUF2141 domain-containing protein [Luminiphilus sp. nBUS_07]|uniref:DUF2141 domain-containing protein n=1 Tax=Luminiphilus sp. nBUS_07 TaxID=3395314 RepID=UPI003EB80658